MATKGSSEVIKSPAEQDEIRRQAKKNRRCTKGKPKGSIVHPDQTYTHGRAVDVLKSRCDEMSRILQWKMHSPSPKIDRALESAMEVYLGCFADIKWRDGEHPRKRHDAAVMVAVNGMNESLSRYAKAQFRIAFTKTGPQY